MGKFDVLYLFVSIEMYDSKNHRIPINKLPYETRCMNLFHACNVKDCTHVKMHCGVNCSNVI